MTDFQEFIEANGLLKSSVAKFLGVSNAFVTQLCSGDRNLPEDKKAIIKANTEGWDTSMFDRHQSIAQSGDGNTNVVINGDNAHSSIDARRYYSDSPDVLRAQIELLDERIKEKDAQIKEKDAQIKEKDAQIKEKDAQIKQLLDILAKK